MGRFENPLPRQHSTGPGAGKGWKAMMGTSVYFSNGYRVHMWCWDGHEFACLHKKLKTVQKRTSIMKSRQIQASRFKEGKQLSWDKFL